MITVIILINKKIPSTCYCYYYSNDSIGIEPEAPLAHRLVADPEHVAVEGGRVARVHRHCGVVASQEGGQLSPVLCGGRGRLCGGAVGAEDVGREASGCSDCERKEQIVDSGEIMIVYSFCLCNLLYIFIYTRTFKYLWLCAYFYAYLF